MSGRTQLMQFSARPHADWVVPVHTQQPERDIIQSSAKYSRMAFDMTIAR